MPKSFTVYDLLISCASDVSEHIAKIEHAVDSFNNHYGRLNDIIIRPVHWSRNAYPTMEHRPPQEVLNEQIVDGADMAVGIFWTRFGTPTAEYGSGVEEEIERMVSQEKQVFLYFLDSPMSPSEIDFEQYRKVKEFKTRHKKDGIYFEIEDVADLTTMFYEHLSLYFDGIIHGPAFKKGNAKREILWVDDRPENNVYERKTLEQYGLEFTLALSTQQALSYLHNRKFSLIISDMERKEGPQEGYVLLNEVRKIDRTVPFIVYAGSRKAEHLQRVIDCGGQGYTNDPAELVDLVIRNLLRGD